MSFCRSLLGVALSMTLGAAFASDLSNLPDQSEWLMHTHSIEKFYLHPDAKGSPLGNFPTWRCNDGALRGQKLCEGESTLWGMEKIWDLDFVRMQSRQTFAYGALYNLTGDPELLRLHKAGVRFLMEKALKEDGGAYNVFKNGVPAKTDAVSENTQDLSYALVGLAMNAYLTGDEKVIEAIVKTQKYIFENYYDKTLGMLLWTHEDSMFDKKDQLELVAQLDQINAYMLLTWRLVPKTYRKEWGDKIGELVKIINERFYVKDGSRFVGCLHNQSCFDPKEGRHSDYGHRIKTFWMEYLYALGAGDNALMKFAKQGMKDTLKEALKPDNKGWYESINKNDASWWVYAELDQSALTLKLTDDIKLPDTFKTFLREMTDTEYGELLSVIKTHYWRNGFHSSEHALIGTILSNAIRADKCADVQCMKANSTQLYFAPVNKDLMSYTPYLYGGRVSDVKDREDGSVLVTFDKVGLPKRVN